MDPAEDDDHAERGEAEEEDDRGGRGDCREERRGDRSRRCCGRAECRAAAAEARVEPCPEGADDPHHDGDAAKTREEDRPHGPLERVREQQNAVATTTGERDEHERLTRDRPGR
jgi:hypothetical protein